MLGNLFQCIFTLTVKKSMLYFQADHANVKRLICIFVNKLYKTVIWQIVK